MKFIKVNLIVFLLIELLLLININLFAQNAIKFNVRGILIDSITHQPISYASLAIVTPNDNKIIKSTICGESGAFKISGVSAGRYNLVISCISYGKSSIKINVGGTEKSVDIGKIKLSKQSVTLQDVVIEGLSIPIMVKGDTIEFNAASFKTDSNAVVEELIKKLPGIEVDKDGNIKAQGKDVMRVFVDGKPFFGDDPKMATKNLPVNMFEKVQIIDKKSDQAVFTQIDDGEVETIMNLITKRSKKDGTFGKATAGIGDDGRYDESANINWFKDARQVSVIGTLNNINNIRFSDFSTLGQTPTSGNVFNKDISSTSGIYSANSNGVSKSWSAGTNYRDSIGSKISFVGSYLYSGNDNSKILTDGRKTLLADSSFITNTNQNTPSLSKNHNIHMEFDYGIDSMNSIYAYPHLKVNNTSYDQLNYYSTLGSKGDSINKSNSEKIRDRQSISSNVEVLLRHRFHKPRRTLSLSVQVSDGPSINKGYNFSNSVYFPDTTNYPVNHRKYNLTSAVSLDTKLSYTEPITYNFVMELYYRYIQVNSASDRNTYNFNPIDNLYDSIYLKLTNRIENTYQNQRAGINFKVFKNKWDYTFGVGVEPSVSTSRIIYVDSTLTYTQHVVNFFPQLIINVTPRKGKKFSIKYKGYTNQPTINQLQPIVDNSNPLYLYIGNPNLKPEFVNDLTINYNSTNLTNFNYFYTVFNFENTINSISNNVSYDTTGVQTTTPININGTYNMNLNTGIGKPLKKFFLSLGCSTGFINDINYLNQVNFTTKVLNLGINSRVNYNGDRLTFAPIVKVSLNKAWYDLANRPDAQYINYNLGFEFQADIFWNIKLGSDIQYIKNNGYGQGYNLDMTIWNAFISEQIFANKRGIIKFQIYDLLNQNKSIFRTTSTNYIEDTKVNTLSRFFIVSFSYSFSKVTGKHSKVKGIKKKKIKDPELQDSNPE